MNYDKLSRSLRYYYEKGIMQKVMLANNLSNLNLLTHKTQSFQHKIYFIVAL